MWISVPISEYILQLIVAWMLSATDCWWQQEGMLSVPHIFPGRNGDSDTLAKVNQDMTEAQLHGHIQTQLQLTLCSEPLGCDWICKHWLRHWVQATTLIFCANCRVTKHPNFQAGTVLSRSSFLYLKTYLVQISSSGAACWPVRKGNTQETSQGSLSACPTLQLSLLLCGSWEQSQPCSTEIWQSLSELPSFQIHSPQRIISRNKQCKF